MASKVKNKRAPKIKPVNNFLLLAVLSVFQLVTGCGGCYTACLHCFAFQKQTENTHACKTNRPK